MKKEPAVVDTLLDFYKNIIKKSAHSISATKTSITMRNYQNSTTTTKNITKNGNTTTTITINEN
jgi:hypothetical protein